MTVSSLGATQLHFLEPGVKVNGDYYRNAVLLNMLLLDIHSIFGDDYVIQQDGEQAHRARDTVTMLQRETPEFIPMPPFAIRVFQHPQSFHNFRLRQMHTQRDLDQRGLKNASVAIRIITLPS